MRPFLSLAYAILVYAFFVATFAYAAGFVGNIAVPKSIDTGASAPLGEALVVNLALLALFAVQHSVMARRSFKRWWTRIVPAHLERSTFCLAATLALALLFWQWRPIAAPIVWNATSPLAAAILEGVFWLGWGLGLVSTFLIDHFELFGLRQVWVHARETEIPAADFQTPSLYRYVRHPLYLGLLLAFWATPVMTAGHLLFSAACTGYILVGIWFEERDLVAQFGDRYRRYRKQVGMLVPMKREGA